MYSAVFALTNNCTFNWLVLPTVKSIHGISIYSLVRLTVVQNGRTSLHLASQNGHKEVIEVLLNSGAVVDKADKVAYLAIYNNYYYYL